LLAGQGLNVVIATISMFHECRRWNRANLPHYFEIYLRVPRDILSMRRSANAGANPERSQMESVVGWDLPFDEPLNPDLIIDNDGSMAPQEVADSIWSKVVASL
jgi:adenylylsulfate kinase